MSGPRAGDRADGALRNGGAPVLGFAMALACLACADSINPIMGGMRLGIRAGALHMPVMLNERPPFHYPPDAWKAGVGGTTILRLHISKTGVVDSAYVDVSSGNASLDSAALAGARELRFRPARQGEEPVEVWVRQPIIYPMPEEVRALRDDETAVGDADSFPRRRDPEGVPGGRSPERPR